MQFSNMGIGGIAYKKRGLNGNSSDSLMVLLDSVERFNRISDFDQILAEIGHATKKVMRARASSLLLLDENTDELCLTSCTGPVGDEVKGKRIPRDHGFSGWVAEHKLPLIANGIDEDKEMKQMFGGELSDQFTTQNIICAPLLDEDNNLIGVIEAINRNDSQEFSEEDIPIFQALANHAATAIERSRDLEKRNDLLTEQDMYLTEIHHRVKNDLALISGIVEIESLDIENDDARHVLRNIQSRIKSMAVVYELLSDGKLEEDTEIGAYFKELAEGISYGLNSRTKKIDVNIDADPVILDPCKSLSCGLILNELMLNSYKHAFNEKDKGNVDISLRKSADTITIDYRDDGPGLPDDFKLEEQDSIGFNMVDALVDQLEGTLKIHKGEGAHFAIQFKINMNGKEQHSQLDTVAT